MKPILLFVFILCFASLGFSQADTIPEIKKRSDVKHYSIIGSANISKARFFVRSERDVIINPSVVGLYGQFSIHKSERWSYGPLTQFSILKSSKDGSFSTTERSGYEFSVGGLARYMLARAEKLNLFVDSYAMFNFEHTKKTLINDTGSSDSHSVDDAYGTLNFSVGMNWVFSPKWSFYASFSPSGMKFKEGIELFSKESFVRRLKYFVGVEYSFGPSISNLKKKKRRRKK